jgi:hypothetical protein
MKAIVPAIMIDPIKTATGVVIGKYGPPWLITQTAPRLPQ